MTQPSILILSTYPSKKPRHGGQLRVENIKKTYQENGFNVASLVFYEAESYDATQVDIWDIPFFSDSHYRLYKNEFVPLITDLLTGNFAASDEVFELFLSRIPKQLDFVELEQAWLYPLVSRLKKLPQYKYTKIINSSHNIEYQLKSDIFSSYNIKNKNVINDILELEKQVALNADINVGVTDFDCHVLKGWGAKNVILAKNGISPWNALPEKIKYWQKKLPKEPFILYVASAHPPNFVEFVDFIGGSLACIPPDSKLVVAGGVSEHIYRELANSRWGAINLSRLELLFILEDEDLNAVKELASVFLLPIPMGGGSNIKTAEALYSGKWVISSTHALRGFENFKGEERLKICHNPKELHETIRKILSANTLPKLTESSEKLRQTLTWQYSLQPMADIALERYENKNTYNSLNKL